MFKAMRPCPSLTETDALPPCWVHAPPTSAEPQPLAEVGGAWTQQGGSASFSVSDGQGRIALNISDTRASRLLAVATDAVAILTTVAVDRTGAGCYASVIGRQVGSDMYSARLWFEANGVVRLYALRNESALANSCLLYTSDAAD